MVIARSMFLAIAAAFLAMATAFAQSPSMPFVWPRTVTTSSAQVIGANNQRRRLLFVNPNATAKIAVCPVISRVNSAAVTCTVNGAGSITLLPYGSIQLDGAGNPTASVPTAWNAISDSVSSALTILEWE